MWKPTHVDVTVIKAKDLVIKGKTSNDVYAIIQMGKEKFQTTTREKTTKPEWNEECSFEIPSDMTKTIEISLLHRNLLSIDRFLGRVVLPIDELLSFQDKPHAQWYALRAKTSKKKAKYRGELLVRTTFVFRSDALNNSSAGNQAAASKLGADFLRKSATNLALTLGGAKKSFRDKKKKGESSTNLASEDGKSRRLSRSHSLAALTVALKRASFSKKGSKHKDKADDNISISHSPRYEDSDDDQSESVASHVRVESDEERDDFDGGDSRCLDDSTVIQRKQYSLPHSVGSASQAIAASGGISRAVSSISAGDRFLERDGSGRLKHSSKSLKQHNSNDSQVSGTGGMQRQASARSSASESGLSIDARSQSSGIAYSSTYGTPPNNGITRTSIQGSKANTNGSKRLSTAAPGMTPNGHNKPKGDSLRRQGSGRHHNRHRPVSTENGGVSNGIELINKSEPRSDMRNSSVIPSDIYAEYGRMSREELLQVIATLKIEISRHEEYVDNLVSRVILNAPSILQMS